MSEHEVRCPACGSTEIDSLEQDTVRQEATWEVVGGQAEVVDWGNTNSWGDGNTDSVGWICCDCGAYHVGDDVTAGLLVDDAAPLRSELRGMAYPMAEPPARAMDERTMREWIEGRAAEIDADLVDDADLADSVRRLVRRYRADGHAVDPMAGAVESSHEVLRRLDEAVHAGEGRAADVAEYVYAWREEKRRALGPDAPMPVCVCGHSEEEHSDHGEEFPCSGDDEECWCTGFEPVGPDGR